MRLQILRLPATPDDPAPFALIIDECNDKTTAEAFQKYVIENSRSASKAIGARGALVFWDRVEVVQ